MAETGYSRSPKLLKGALIQFSAPLLVPTPSFIIFQYNPETLSRTLTPWAPPVKDEHGNTDPKIDNQRAQPYDPKETFNLALELDAADALEEPVTHRVAVISGVADRIAALEMLLYPPGDSPPSGLLSGSVSVSAGGVSLSASAEVVVVAERQTVPIVLFSWGPGRIVPVRIESFTVDEQAFSPTLYPIRAKVTLGLKVLDAATFEHDDSAEVKIAKACYTFRRDRKETLARQHRQQRGIDHGALPF